MTTRVVVIDYGIGNVFSVCNALQAVGADVCLSRSSSEIMAADRLILPGVGAFGRAMEALDHFALAGVISEFISTGKPFLGICIGMQMLMERSTEFGDHRGLGYFKGSVERVASVNPRGEPVRVPNIGWSNLREVQSFSGTPLSGVNSGSVYFVHSYHCRPSDEKHLLSTIDYNGLPITAAIRRENIIGVQFHPERSGLVGLGILDRFVKTQFIAK